MCAGPVALKHLIWDWNGTLLDDVEASVATFNSLLAERSLPPVTLSRYRNEFAFPAKCFYRKCGIDTEAGDWDEIARTYHERITSSPLQRIRPDARAALEEVAAAGVRQSVLSALRQDLLDRQLGEFGLCGYFDFAAGSDNLDGAHKKEAGARFVERLGVPRPAIALVGDTLTDAETARHCGIACALVTCGHQSAARLASAGAPLFPSLLAAVRSLLRGPGRNVS